MARRSYRAWRSYRRYKRSRAVRRLLKRYKPLSGYGINGERFKIDVPMYIRRIAYNQVYQYTFYDATGAVPANPLKGIRVLNYYGANTKIAALGAIYDQCRVYGLALTIVGAGQQAPTNILEQAQNYRDTSTVILGATMQLVNDIGTKPLILQDVAGFEKKVILSKTKTNQRLYVGRKWLGSVEGFGTGDYVPWAWTMGTGNEHKNLQLWISNMGTVTEDSPQYNIICTLYVECKINHI